MQLKIYQENAIEELLEKAKKLLDYPGRKSLVFKSPTASGKTIMMAEFLKQLVEDREIKQPLSFIWTAPRQLHIQSKDKLDRYYEESRALKCSYFEDLDDRKIGENEILLFNWESINRVDNVYIRENERDNNLTNVLERTKEEGREMILIIDESHHHATSEISQGLIQMIGPKLTIEVSATPVLRGDKNVDVDIEEVKSEGMVKKGVILNEDFKNIAKKEKIKSELSGGSEKLVIKQTLKKRKELIKAYKKEKVKINPLVLIQLPNRIGKLEDEMKNRVIRILKDEFKISTENGKLAIWLSDEHVNKENVEKKDSEVEVLIFKQAIALGWDCPRAHILILFRFWKSLIFSIQTVGRIMRMPDPGFGHYKNETLNYAYAFTNLEDIEIREDIAKDYISVYTSERKKVYKPINLSSCHSERHREKTRLASFFINIFLDEARKYKLKKKIDIKSKKLDLKFVSDWKAKDIDALAGAKIVGDKLISAGSTDLQNLFDYFVRNNLTPFYPEDRSVGRVKEAIYRFFEKELKIKYEEKQDEIIQIVLSDKNIQRFVNVIDTSKVEYQKEVEKREPEIVLDENWNVPESRNFGGDYIEKPVRKSILQPFYSKDGWKTEKAFIEFLEKSKNVKWWFKNGDRDAIFFAVPYKNEEVKPFYVDFIVVLKDKRIGLFDTKSGITRQVAGPKMEGLFRYVKGENKKGKKLFGGIVTNTDPRNYRGRWVYFDKSSRDLKDEDLSNWKNLEL